MVLNFNLKLSALGHLTSAVQFGFIIGTLVFAILTIADRFSPSKVFFISALFGATFNLGIIWNGHTLTSLLLLRFLTGFCLAGIYPIGMKIATDYFNTGLGKSLGFLVGALVLGTAFPHLLKDFTSSYPWKSVLITTSTLAVIGGLLILFLVPNGPYRKPSLHTNFKACFTIFKKHNFRHAAFGYFGHMWELYAFWVFTPIILKQYSINHNIADLNIPLLSFLIIGLGGVACIISGYIAQHIGTKKSAFIALLLSCICCLLSSLLFTVTSTNIFVGFLMFWGMVVVADSPLLSTLIAESATPQLKGTSLTIVNCIGFAISIISIQLLTALIETTTSNGIYVILALGPILGLLALSGKKKPTISQ